jgi:hypothetical protein
MEQDGTTYLSIPWAIPEIFNVNRAPVDLFVEGPNILGHHATDHHVGNIE